MTAFASVEQKTQFGQAKWEIKSVNHRFLELSFRLPESLRGQEHSFRDIAKKYLNRGKVDCYLFYQTQESAQAALKLNQALVEQLGQAAGKVLETFRKQSGLNPTFSVAEILRWPAVLQEEQTQIPENLNAEIEKCFEAALQTLVAARQTEGQQLKEILIQKMNEMLNLIQEIKQRSMLTIKQHQEKLVQKIKEIKTDVNQDRLEQELVYLTSKLDITEEIDRLIIHLNSARENLNQDKGGGRQLDFLAQELNREVNTLAAKAADIEISQKAIDLKVLIEKIREQVQNIE